MILNDRLRNFIKENKDLINEYKFKEIYNKINASVGYGEEDFKEEDVGTLTQLFYNVGLDPLKDLKRIPHNYLCGSDITTFNIPKNITFIGYEAFDGSNITSIIIPDNVTKIGFAAFRDSALKEIVLGKGLKRIEAEAFYRIDEPELKVSYNGTIDELENIKVESDNDDLFNAKIKCTDGESYIEENY